MSNGPLHVWNKLRFPKTSEELEDSLEGMVKACQRNVVQFARLAALARAIGDRDLSNLDRILLSGAIEELADRAELETTFDAESLQLLLNGQRHNRRPERADHQCESDDPSLEVFVMPSTSTKH